MRGVGPYRGQGASRNAPCGLVRRLGSGRVEEEHDVDRLLQGPTCGRLGARKAHDMHNRNVGWTDVRCMFGPMAQRARAGQERSRGAQARSQQDSDRCR